MNKELELAVTWVETGQLQKGLDKLRSLQSEADDDTLFVIADQYQQWGMTGEALPILKQLQDKYPDESALHLALAEAAIDENDEDLALRSLEMIKPDDDNYLSAQVLLADLYQAQGLDEAAEHRLKEALAKEPDHPVLTFALGEFYLATGQPANAVPYYRHCLHSELLAHENVQAKLAEALSLSGSFEEALIHYKKAKENTLSLDGWFGYGMTAMRLGQYKLAIELLGELKNMDPHYASLYPVLAEAYEKEGALDEALDTFEEGIQADENNERLYEEAARLAVNQNELGKAETLYKDLLLLNPEHSEALKKLVELNIDRSDYEEVIALLAPADIADDPELSWYLASAYREEDELDKSFALFRQVADHFSSNPDFLFEYAQVLRENGQSAESLDKATDASRLAPDDPEMAEFVERLRQERETGL